MASTCILEGAQMRMLDVHNWWLADMQTLITRAGVINGTLYRVYAAAEAMHPPGRTRVNPPAAVQSFALQHDAARHPKARRSPGIHAGRTSHYEGKMVSESMVRRRNTSDGQSRKEYGH